MRRRQAHRYITHICSPPFSGKGQLRHLHSPIKFCHWHPLMVFQTLIVPRLSVRVFVWSEGFKYLWFNYLNLILHLHHLSTSSVTPRIILSPQTAPPVSSFISYSLFRWGFFFVSITCILRTLDFSQFSRLIQHNYFLWLAWNLQFIMPVTPLSIFLTFSIIWYNLQIHTLLPQKSSSWKSSIASCLSFAHCLNSWIFIPVLSNGNIMLKPLIF